MLSAIGLPSLLRGVVNDGVFYLLVCIHWKETWGLPILTLLWRCFLPITKITGDNTFESLTRTSMCIIEIRVDFLKENPKCKLVLN